MSVGLFTDYIINQQEKKDGKACLTAKVEEHSRIRYKISHDLRINQDTLVPFPVISPV